MMKKWHFLFVGMEVINRVRKISHLPKTIRYICKIAQNFVTPLQPSLQKS